MVEQPIRRALDDNFSAFHNITPVGDGQGLPDVLLDKQDGDPAFP